jgi:cyclase
MTSRRGFLRATLGSCWTGAALLEQSVFRANLARAQATPDMPSLFDIQKVANGTYAAIAKQAAVLNCNAAIFENSEDLLIVDTHSKPSAVVSLIAQLQREVSKKPVRYVVNSHFHWDHSQGTSAYKKANPQAHLKESVEQMRATLETTEKQRGASKDPAEIRRLSDQAAGIRSYIAEMNNYRPELPDVTFDRELILHDKGRELHIAFRGRAHTSGDVVVFCPQSKVVATGDMIHSSLPFIGDAYPAEWPVTMRSVAELPFDYVIGGHGRVQYGKDVLRGMAGYIEELTAAVARDKGRPLAELQAAITPGKLRSLSGDYGKYLLQNAGGNSLEALAGGVRTNVAHVYERLGAV